MQWLLLFRTDYSVSAAVSAVAECVWAHYLTATGSPDAGKATVLSATQQREIWLQYSALRVAFQVGKWTHTVRPVHSIQMVLFCGDVLIWTVSSSSLRLISRVYRDSQRIALYCIYLAPISSSFHSLRYPRINHLEAIILYVLYRLPHIDLFFHCPQKCYRLPFRLIVILGHMMNSCLWSPPS